jgi:hypothetical protein
VGGRLYQIFTISSYFLNAEAIHWSVNKKQISRWRIARMAQAHPDTPSFAKKILEIILEAAAIVEQGMTLIFVSRTNKDIISTVFTPE